MKTTAIKKDNAAPTKETGGPFSHYEFSAGAVLIKAFAEIMTAMKKAESLYNNMMNESIKLQVVASTANAKAAKRSMELEADQMRTSAWTSIASGAAAFANTAADLYLSYQSSKAADEIAPERKSLESDIENAQAYKTAFGKARIASLTESEKPEEKTENIEVQKIINEADERAKTPVGEDGKTIELSKMDTEAKEGIEAYDEVIKNRRQKLAELQDKLTEIRNKFQQIQTVFGNMRGWTTDIPNSIANFLNEAKKRLQSVQEALKVLQGSTEQMNRSLESQMAQQYNSAVQRLNEVAQQFKELTAGDAYRGG